MATTPPPDAAVALTDAFRAAQARRAAITAALVAQYYRTRVNVEDPSSIDSWLALVVPRILGDRRASASLAATYANTLRRLELPKATDGFNFAPTPDLDAAVVRASLSAVGVAPVRSKYADIRALPDRPGDGSLTGYDAQTKQALIAEADRVAAKRVAGSVARHVQNGARQTIFDGVKADPVALGYIRVTKADPCYFCAMLASRGPVFADDSFDESDPRFTGDGNAKVHDSCGCALKPLYRRDDPMADRSKEFETLWNSLEHKSGSAAILQFRQAYEGRLQHVGD